jgi:glutamate synthase (ferredoxin)
MLQVPHKFLKKVTAPLGIELGEARDYGVGMFFLPQDELTRNRAKKTFETIVRKEGMTFLGWREVPVNADILGKRARDCMPVIYQAFIKRPQDAARGLEFDRKLYIARREFEQSNEETYIPSLSSRTIVYKGMFLVKQLRLFYLDLLDEDTESAIAIVHSRFSTNTNPSWERAHPNRFIVHNGEINTIQGNADRMLAREESMKTGAFRDSDFGKILPVVNTAGSDSAMLDNTLEFLVMSGMELPKAVMITIPEPWENNKAMDYKKRDFYQYYATMMEPWDGPASILFSDGDIMGAVLDRNGLRPSRYYITDDNRLILASEVGVFDLPVQNIVKKSRLTPGKMLLVDTVQGRVIEDDEIKMRYAASQPYGEWLDQQLVTLDSLDVPNQRPQQYGKQERVQMLRAFGYTYENLKTAIEPMARTGAEPTASMGIDTPLAVLSDQHQPLFNFFKQHFAQVTNPPLDAIREEIVTSSTVYLGSDGNILQEGEKNCHVLRVDSPILTNLDLMRIRNMKKDGFKVETISILYYKGTSLERALEQIQNSVDRAYRDGANIIILSDRGVDETHVAIPSLLAVSATAKYLVRTKKRTAVALILESGEPREVHHFATLLGYGASAINPYMAYEAIDYMIEENLLDKDYYMAVQDYNKAVCSGIVKIASKMGVSTVQSYQGSQIFEAIGIERDVIDKYFTGTVSRVGGVGLKQIAEDAEKLHSQAFDPLGLAVDTSLPSDGSHKYRAEQETHLYSPMIIHLLQTACWTGSYEKFKEYTTQVDRRETIHTLRGALEFVFAEDGGIPLDEVEPVESIVKRFKTGAMSFGSLSKEAHECMAIAMNSIGGKSNTGEGGEDTSRFTVGADGLNRNSAIKQVASGRFGVTSAYLMSAKEIQIKMAQGAKPGEGGHLPGTKVYPWVAATRYSTPGVALISPPPHHDIYSIEDLAQLIFDLKNANRAADINVKLVSEAGVGTVAAGVAKAGSQVILVSGFDGGTGAAPRSSIQNAGLPWELGVAETHQTLIQNGLRSRVRLETDGKLMSGRDVAIACMLGAEEFGFATAPLITMGCVMMRVCNQDTCPVGITTQNPALRNRFKGKPEYVVNFMKFIAQELREIMAKLGVRTVDELVGRTDLLRKRTDLTQGRVNLLDLSAILDNPFVGAPKQHFDAADAYDFHLRESIDERVLLKEFAQNLKTGEKKEISLTVTSTDRALGTILGSEITRCFGDSLAEDTFTVSCTGGGGQSFGAFIPKGLTLRLRGDSNDYFGKGLSGGKLVLSPPEDAAFRADENIIVGNVALYGATAGKAFIAGVAGERFCVRNSGAYAVVEGVGDHGCEYMTGGRAVILGQTGKNFAAGMSGGVVYLLDEDSTAYQRINKGMIKIEEVTNKYDVQELKELIAEHVAETGSVKGQQVLDHFADYLPKFKKIIPVDYDRMLKTVIQMEEKGLSTEQAQFEAFYALRS